MSVSPGRENRGFFYDVRFTAILPCLSPPRPPAAAGARWVLHLQPVRRPPRAIARAEPLRDGHKSVTLAPPAHPLPLAVPSPVRPRWRRGTISLIGEPG